MSNLAALPHSLDRERRTCLAVIETPRGGQAKIGYDPGSGAFRLARFLPLGLGLPFDFGFVPSTRGGDGDPLDVMVLAEAPLPMGCVLDVRLIGALEAEQTKAGRRVRNDRLLAVACASHLYAELAAIEALPEVVTRELVAFWTTYNRLRGEDFHLIALAPAERAASIVEAAAQSS